MTGGPRDCIIFATADWVTPYWTNKQHMARVMAKRGWRVLYVESIGFRSPRVGSRRDWSRMWYRLRRGLRSLFVGPDQVERNIWVMSPLVIPAARRLAPLNRWFIGSVIRRFVNRHKFQSPMLWTYHPYLAGTEDIARGPLVYHCVDDVSAVPGVDEQRYQESERALLRAADLVFTTSRSLSDKCKLLNPNTHYLPNVADSEHFGRALSGPLHPEIAAIPEPRLVYHGTLSYFKVDLELLHDVATAHPEWQFVLIGDEEESARSDWVPKLRRLDNIHHLGHRDYAELPEYLRGMSVGLLPNVINGFTTGMYPMKFHEYLAAGLPVAATPTAFTREAHAGLDVGAGVEDFAAAIARQLARGRLTLEEAAAAVGDNTWEKRMDRMEELLAPRKAEAAE